MAALAGCGRRAAPGVMIQVETGDEREGVPEERCSTSPPPSPPTRACVLEGVSTNYACFHGARPRYRASVEAVARAARALARPGFAVERVSGGNSSVLWLARPGERLPAEVTELRCGEALLLGQDALFYEPLPGCRARRLRAQGRSARGVY